MRALHQGVRWDLCQSQLLQNVDISVPVERMSLHPMTLVPVEDSEEGVWRDAQKALTRPDPPREWTRMMIRQEADERATASRPAPDVDRALG